MQITFDLPARPAAPRDARRALDGLRGHVDPPAIDTLKLLVTELVTNSLRHCKTSNDDWRVHVNVEVRRDHVYVEVCDPGVGFEVDLGRPSPFEVSGRGLFLVDQLAQRWGVLGESTSCVWFELSTGGRRHSVVGRPGRSGRRYS